MSTQKETELKKITSYRASVRHLKMLDQLLETDKKLLTRGGMIRHLIEEAYEKRIVNARRN